MVENYFDLLNKFKEVYPTIIMVGGLPISVRIDGLKYKFTDYNTVKTDNYYIQCRITNSNNHNIVFEKLSNEFSLYYCIETDDFNIIDYSDCDLISGKLSTGILDNIYNEEDYETDLSKWNDEFLLYAKLKGWL